MWTLQVILSAYMLGSFAWNLCNDEIMVQVKRFTQIMRVNLANLQAFLGRLKARCSVEGYATGNFSPEQAADLGAVVTSLLQVRL